MDIEIMTNGKLFELTACGQNNILQWGDLLHSFYSSRFVFAHKQYMEYIHPFFLVEFDNCVHTDNGNNFIWFLRRNSWNHDTLNFFFFMTPASVLGDVDEMEKAICC